MVIGKDKYIDGWTDRKTDKLISPAVLGSVPPRCHGFSTAIGCSCPDITPYLSFYCCMSIQRKKAFPQAEVLP